MVDRAATWGGLEQCQLTRPNSAASPAHRVTMAVHTKALVTMEEICDLEMRIDALAADNDRLIQLWEEMDLNHNAELSFSEVLTFMSRHHPILAEKHLLRHAFLASADDEDKSGCKIVKPEHFRLFLINVFRSAKLAPHVSTSQTQTYAFQINDLSWIWVIAVC